MSWSINSTEGRVIAATGETFEAYHLNPERADILLAAIDAHGGKASTAQLAQALGRNIPDASRLLQELAGRGSVCAVLEKNRPQWKRRTLDLNTGLVTEAHKPHILAFLVGRRELPGRIAADLGLPREEIAETCKALMVEGQLVGTPIGAAMVYALDIRGSTRVDLEAAAQVAQSPGARFQAELAALPPEKAVPLAARPKPTRAKLRLQPQQTTPFANTRRGLLGDGSRAVLEVFRQPLKLRDAINRLGLDESLVWTRVTAMCRSGYLKRCAPSTYVLTPDGVKVLRPLRNTRPVFAKKVPSAPAGKGWTTERTAWLTEHYARLGHRGAAKLLGIGHNAVWARARLLGLKFGDIPGYVLLIDLAKDIAGMHGTDPINFYTNLWARASRAGVFKYGDGDLDRKNRRVLVPAKWADEIRLERTPPAATDMPLAELMARAGLSKTQAGRRAAPTYLRTATGGPPCVHLSRERGEALVLECSRKVRRQDPGKAGLLAKLEAAGANGMTEKELLEALGVTRAAVRHHLRQFQLRGPQPLEKCREGISVDPTVWRLACHVAAPQPKQRLPDTSKWGAPRGKRKQKVLLELEEAAD